MKFVVILFAINWLSRCGECARILAIFPFPAKSHFSPFEPLLKKLSDNGHEVTVIGNFPQKTKHNNLTDIDLSTHLPSLVGTLSPMIAENFTIFGNAVFMTSNGGFGICKPVLTHPKVSKLIESDEKFDLIISEVFATDCFLGFVHKFQAPWVGLTSSVALPWSNDAIGGIENPSYIPGYFSSFSDRMNIFQRFLNTAQLLMLKIVYKICSEWPSYQLAKEIFGPDLPDFDELRSKLALLLVNGHPAVSTLRPLAPGIKEIGGIHIPTSNPPALSKDLMEYLDGSKDGVVYFSMGSQIDAAKLPPKILQAFVNTFGKLAPRRVLWKCNENHMPNLPKNVKCIDWAPQLSVLCHTNVRVFMSHGGLLGTQEAVHCGVPILGLALFGDQYLNLAHGKKEGFALESNFYDIDENDLLSNLQKLLTDSSYSKRAEAASRKFRDRLVPPLDEAVFWVEYVLRHGPQALRTAACDLSWYQHLLLDIIAGIILVTCLIYYLFKKCMLLAFFSPKQKSHSKQKMKSN